MFKGNEKSNFLMHEQKIGESEMFDVTVMSYFMARISEASRGRKEHKINGILNDYKKTIENKSYQIHSDHEDGLTIEAKIYTDGNPRYEMIYYKNYEVLRYLNGEMDSEDGIRETIQKGDILEVFEYQGKEYDPPLTVELLEDIDDDGMTTFKTITKGLITNSILELPNTGDININENNTHWKRILE